MNFHSSQSYHFSMRKSMNKESLHSDKYYIVLNKKDRSIVDIFSYWKEKNESKRFEEKAKYNKSKIVAAFDEIINFALNIFNRNSENEIRDWIQTLAYSYVQMLTMWTSVYEELRGIEVGVVGLDFISYRCGMWTCCHCVMHSLNIGAFAF